MMLGGLMLASACSGSAEDYSGFVSSEECLKAMPIVRPDIAADALGDRCGVSEEMADIALTAASVSTDGSDSSATGADSSDGSDGQGGSKDADDSSGADSSDSGQGSSNTTQAQRTTTTAKQTTTTSEPATTTTEPPPIDGIEVPNVMGLDHQLAQDTMQFAGLRNLSEEDASGEGRRLLWDRNWIVVGQTPEPGLIVDKDTEIILYSLKDNEIDDQ
jgi:hypothetical protein